MVALSVYAAALVLAFAASSALHAAGDAASAARRRLDHGAIHLLIAATYTPFAVMAPAGAGSWLVLAVLWCGALAGVLRESGAAGAGRPSLPVYLAMGWIAVAGAAPLAAGVGAVPCAWLLAGAACYSGGTVFFRNRRGWTHAHGAWHLAVLAGAACHFASIASVLHAVQHGR